MIMNDRYLDPNTSDENPDHWEVIENQERTGHFEMLELTQNRFGLIDETVNDLISSYTWRAIYKQNNWYVVTDVPAKGEVKYRYRNGRLYKEQVYKRLHLHTLLTGWQMVDHINGNGLDNRSINLRAATPKLNRYNRKTYRM